MTVPIAIAGAALAAGLLAAAWRLRPVLRRLLGGQQVLQSGVTALPRLLALPPVSLKGTRPLGVLPSVPPESPFSGLGRPGWVQIATWMLDNLLQYADPVDGLLRLPDSRAAHQPRLGPDGRLVGVAEARMEAEVRSLFLAAPLLRHAPALRLQGFSVADRAAEWLVRAVRPGDEAWLGYAPADRPNQRLVEAAALCVMLDTAREALWDRLAPAERGRVLDWLEHLRHVPVVDNNWRWFAIIVQSFLGREGRDPGTASVRGHLAALDRMHAGDGWYRDGSRFDYYASWSLQFYPVFWANWAGDREPAWRDTILERQDAFLRSFPQLYARDGALPLWGRSICYRFGASAAIAAAFLRSTPPAIAPGFARRLCSGNLLQFVRAPGFLRHGLVPLGFHGEQPDLIDGYSSVASPYWCGKLFVALALPPAHPFWTAPEEEGYWTAPPGRQRLGDTGLEVAHDPATGESRLFAPGNGDAGDPRYAAPWFDTADARYAGTDIFGRRGGPARVQERD